MIWSDRTRVGPGDGVVVAFEDVMPGIFAGRVGSDVGHPVEGPASEGARWEAARTCWDLAEQWDARHHGQVEQVLLLGQARLRGPGPDDQAGDLESTGLDRLDGEGCVVERAQTCTSDDHEEDRVTGVEVERTAVDADGRSTGTGELVIDPPTLIEPSDQVTVP